MITAETKMTRSAHGLDSGPDNPWWHQAACRTNPALFDGEPTTQHGHAVHICLTHCPVLGPCRAEVQARKPVGVIQAGVRWLEQAGRDRGPTTIQPINPGCGPWCLALRRRQP